MTDVMGLRLAYRGLVGGLAGAYAWVAIAMTLAALLHGDPLRPLRPLALAVSPLATSFELAFVLGLMAVQAGGALVGICFAYFFGRFFTLRATMNAAAPALALLVWALVATAIAEEPDIVPLLATVGYGVLLGAWVPVRPEVTRYSGSPST